MVAGTNSVTNWHTLLVEGTILQGC